MSKRRQRRRSRVCLHVAEIAAPFRSQGLGGEACDIRDGSGGMDCEWLALLCCR